jgi:hypothetical protein
MAIVAPLVLAGIAGYQAIKSANDSAAAKRRARLNIRPTFNIQDEYYKNQNLAEGLAQGGMTQASKNYYQSQADRGLGSSIGALLQTGGGINSISHLYDSYDKNNMAIAAKDSEQHVDNIRYLMGVNKDLADQKTQKWVLDKYQPYLDEAKSIAGQKAQAAGEMNNSLNTLGSAASAYSTSQLYKDKGGAVKQGPDGSVIAAIDPSLSSPTDRIQGPSKATIPNINIPNSYDQLQTFNDQSRQAAMQKILSNYQNSPYRTDLSAYLQTA